MAFKANRSTSVFTGELSKAQWGFLYRICKTFPSAKAEMGLGVTDGLAYKNEFTPDEHAIAKGIIDKYATRLPNLPKL